MSYLSNDRHDEDGRPEILDDLVPGRDHNAGETCMEKFRRKFGRIPMTVGACVIMLLLGISLILIARLVNGIESSGRIGLYILGGLMLIPSIYVAYILYNVFRDTPGFNLEVLPIWDDML